MGRANSEGRLWISKRLQVQRDRSVAVVETVSRRENVREECPIMRVVKTELCQFCGDGNRRERLADWANTGGWEVGSILKCGSRATALHSQSSRSEARGIEKK